MNLRATYAVFLRQVYLLKGSLTRVVPLMVWPGIDMIIWGFLSRYLNQMNQATFNFVPALLGAVLLWNFLVRVMQGVTISFFEDVWSRNFLSMFGSPLKVSEYVVGLVMTSILTSIIGLAAMLVLASGIFGLSLLDYGLALAPFIAILFLFGIALGIVGTALVLRLGPASEWFVWPIPALLAPFAGVFYPLSVLPEWMQGFARIIPPSYVFESARSIVSGGAADMQALAQGIGLSLLYVLLASLLFMRVFKRAVKSGRLARYSAESQV